MANDGKNTTRLFGGAEPAAAPTTGQQQYQRPLMNAAGQVVVESVAATTRRVFKGPRQHGGYSLHYKITQAAGAASAAKIYYSNLPNPDPTDSTHWVDSGITAIALDGTSAAFLTKQDAWPEWVMIEATITSGTAKLWMYSRTDGVDVGSQR